MIPAPPGRKLVVEWIEIQFYTDLGHPHSSIRISRGDLARFEAAAEAIEVAERTIAAAKRLAALKP